MRTVFLEGRVSGWELHSLYKELIDFPPTGYRFVTVTDKRISKLQNLIYPVNRRIVSYDVVKTLYDYLRPLAYHLYYSLNDGSKPGKTDLIYASQHLVYRKEPWVMDLEHAGALAAYGKVKVLRKVIEKTLRSSYCKKVIPWTEMGKRSLLASIDCRDLKDKIEVIGLAVHPKTFRKRFDDDKIKLLFVGTSNRANISDSFAIKGGNEILKAFESLGNEYKNLELVVRSYVPANLKEKYDGVKNLKIIDKIVSWQVLDHEFRTADIFLFPSHSTPGMAILDAMSYELPVVATDVWANKELVDNRRTGLLISGHSKVHYYDEEFIPLWGEPRFMKTIRHIDPKMVDELIQKTRIMIEDRKLRRRMGKAGRKEIEEGKFSIIARNRKLKKVLDEATGNIEN